MSTCEEPISLWLSQQHETRAHDRPRIELERIYFLSNKNGIRHACRMSSLRPLDGTFLASASFCEGSGSSRIIWSHVRPRNRCSAPPLAANVAGKRSRFGSDSHMTQVRLGPARPHSSCLSSSSGDFDVGLCAWSHEGAQIRGTALHSCSTARSAVRNPGIASAARDTSRLLCGTCHPTSCAWSHERV